MDTAIHIVQQQYLMGGASGCSYAYTVVQQQYLMGGASGYSYTYSTTTVPDGRG